MLDPWRCKVHNKNSKRPNPKIHFSHFACPHQSPVAPRMSFVDRRSSLAARRVPTPSSFLSLFVLTVANPFLTTETQPPQNRFRENRVIILCCTRGDAKSTTRITKRPNPKFHFSQNSIVPNPIVSNPIASNPIVSNPIVSNPMCRIPVCRILSSQILLRQECS